MNNRLGEHLLLILLSQQTPKEKNSPFFVSLQETGSCFELLWAKMFWEESCFWRRLPKTRFTMASRQVPQTQRPISYGSPPPRPLGSNTMARTPPIPPPRPQAGNQVDISTINIVWRIFTHFFLYLLLFKTTQVPIAAPPPAPKSAESHQPTLRVMRLYKPRLQYTQAAPYCAQVFEPIFFEHSRTSIFLKINYSSMIKLVMFSPFFFLFSFLK